MLDLALVILLGVLVLGGVVTWLGVRGRRVNDHPVCRRCRFDLLGVYPGGAKCPECGAGLQRKRAVRDGERRRLRGLVVIGVALLASPAMLMVLGVVLLSSGDRLQAYKPAALLVLEGRFRGKESSKSAATELSRRLRETSLSEREVDFVARQVVAMQRDLKNEWVSEWGALVEELHEAGRINNSAFLDYVRAGCRLEVSVRPRVWCVGFVPVSLEAKETRWSRHGCVATLQVRDMKIDGVSVPREDYPLGDLRPSAAVVFYWATNQRRAFGPQDQRLMLVPKPALRPGRHSVRIEFGAFYVVESALGVIEVQETLEVEREIEAFVEVDDVVRSIAPSTKMTDALGASLDPVGVAVQELSRTPVAGRRMNRATLTFACESLPSSISYDVTIFSGEEEYTIGAIIGREGQKLRTQVSGVFEHAPGERVRVVLRPNRAHARRTLDITEMYAGEIELDEDIMRGRKLAPEGDAPP